MILAGDIGGTNARLALFDGGNELTCVAEKNFRSRDYSSLEQIVHEFLGAKKVSKACFGIPGAIREGRAHPTNLPWVIDTETLSTDLHIPQISLLNDLVANAYGVRMLKEDELFLLHPGVEGQTGNAALIAAGTGLGQAGLYWDGEKHHPFASEGGHVDFSPRDPREIELFKYLKNKYEHISYERVVSGPGIYEIYLFLTEVQKLKVSPIVQEEMKRRNPSKVISEYGLQNKDLVCSETIDWFISLYGAEAGNVALKFLSLGGLYIGGVVAHHLNDRKKLGAFLSAFIDKGRFKELLHSIPIWVILNDQAALLGAAYYAKWCK